MKRSRGRPPKEPQDLITFDQAVQVIEDFLSSKYSPEIAKTCKLAKGTLYNKSASGELHTWRKGKYALLSKAEVIGLVS